MRQEQILRVTGYTDKIAVTKDEEITFLYSLGIWRKLQIRYCSFNKWRH